MMLLRGHQRSCKLRRGQLEGSQRPSGESKMRLTACLAMSAMQVAVARPDVGVIIGG